jgi:hypothetical protein
LEDETEKRVHVYSPNPEFCERFEMEQEYISNYSIEIHKTEYKPILHIEVKQRLYTKGELIDKDNELLMKIEN